MTAALRRRLALVVLLSAAAALMLAAPGRALGLGLTQVASLNEPTYLDDAPGRKNRKLLFVTQKPGQIAVLRGGQTLPSPFLDLADMVASNGEQGLLSMAFSPGYERTRLFYVYFTDKAGDNEVWEFKRAKKSRVRAVRGSGRQVLLIPHPDEATNHNGGQLQFGPDGMLYIAPGDGGSTPRSAQDVNALTGKVLRIDPRKQTGRGHGKKGKKGKGRKSAGAPYGIPRDNPFVGKPGLDEIYALGLRNPYRFSFDLKTQSLLIADVGGSAREELDLLGVRASAGANLGWPRFEGTTSLDTSVQAPGAIPPIFEYDHSGGRCVITGGYVVRDPRLSTLNGRYLYADFCIGDIRGLIPGASGASGDSSLGLPQVSQLSSFGEGRGGQIYALSLAGPVYRLDP